ncbi:MAG: TonB-dependent receptor [Bacteroidetes bacterium]|nr:TonB-dependent receptor [Bacteroidota bacterium]
MKRIYPILILLIGLSAVNKPYAQNLTQVIRGTVVDKQSLVTLPGANVVILGSTPPKGASCAADGSFKITGVSPGRYDLQATYLGYKPVVISSVVVTSGKEAVLEIVLEENISSLNEVVIPGMKKHETINQMATVSARSFSMEEVNRYAGGRSDPSRLVSNFAGVSTPNDSRNDIVIRGNSPAGVLWRIEGLNVPNPNHFVTLGTTGGPVSALNPNALKNSDFFTSAFPADYGNATAGVFDIHLQDGNTEKREHMVQFGALTGLEAMSEGPFKTGGKASYLITYRYSFTGLAQNLGISIGTAATPYYQDLTFKINSGDTKLGRFTLFGLGGTSHIAFLHTTIDSTDIYANPGEDSYSNSTIGVVGVKHFIRLSKKIYWNSVVGITYSENGYALDTIPEGVAPVRVRDSKDKEIRYGINSFLDYKVNAHLMVKAGIQCDFLRLDLRLLDRQYSDAWKSIWAYRGNTSLLAAYLEAKYRISEKFTLDAGLRSQFLTLNNAVSLEPRIGLKYHVNEKNTIGLGFGLHSQMQPLSVYYYRELLPDNTYDESNRALGFTNSLHFVGSYEVRPFKDWRIRTELYYQALYDVPVSQDPNSFSMLNEGSSYAPTEEGNLANNGTGTNYGIELTVEKFFSHGYYALLTGSWYQAKYEGSNGIERNTAFNGNFVYNFLGGKEFKVGKAKRHSVSVDLKFSHAGGRYYTPVDLEASRAAGKQVYMGEAYAFSERYPDFYRLDIKAGFTYNSKKIRLSQTFYIDIQNVTGHQNVFAQQYNAVTKQINTLYQIGFYPNFVYKIQF